MKRRLSLRVLTMALGLVGILAMPGLSWANRTGGVATSNLGSPTAQVHRSPTGTYNKTTHDGVVYIGETG